MKREAVFRRLCIVGSTGLVGSAILEAAVGNDDVRTIAVARREVPLPAGARMEMLVADPSGWPEAIAASKADVFICALGTTMRDAGGSRDAFRAVDHDLVVASARAAQEAGIEHLILVTSVGADPTAKSFYLRTKGEAEAHVRKLGFRRIDILRPSLLVGPRRTLRPLERLGMWLAPVMNLFLHGRARKYRAIQSSVLAQSILRLCRERAAGKFVHEYDAICAASRRRREESGLVRKG